MAETLHYLAYMLRLRRVEDDEECCWRASLEDPHTEERQGFASVGVMYAYLAAQMVSCGQVCQQWNRKT